MSVPSTGSFTRRDFLGVAIGMGTMMLARGRTVAEQRSSTARGAKSKGKKSKTASTPTVWSGGVTTGSAVVKAKIPLGTRARLLVGGAGIEPQPSSGAIATFHLQGLKADTVHEYNLELNGEPAPNITGQFRTMPEGPASFAFAFGSCARTGSAHAVFETIKRREPLFFLHLGDLHYESIGRNDPALFRAAYDAVFGSPTQAALYRTTPLAYVWDDHDFGPNDSDKRSRSRPAALAAYREYIAHHPLAAGGGDAPIYQAFTAGRVRFLMLDCRSERSRVKDADGPGKSLLGTAQKAWLKQEFLAAKSSSALVFLISPVPWIGATRTKPRDSWAGYATERGEIADFIKANGLAGRVCVLCGDAHMLAADSGENSDYATGGGAALPVLHGSSLDKGGSKKGGPYSEGTHQPRKGEGCFGWIEVHDEGSRLVVNYTGRNHRDEVKVKHSFTVKA